MFDLAAHQHIKAKIRVRDKMITRRRYVLYALGAPFAFVAFWGFPIGWSILLVVAIIDLVAIRE